MSETNENKEHVAVGSDSNEGLGDELTAAYFAGFHKRDEEVKQYRELLETLRRDRKLWKSGGAGGQDAYAGLPPALRLIDAVLGPIA